MTQDTMMLIDAALLIWVFLACGILLCADRELRNRWLPTVILTVMGIAVFYHAMWLLGIWWPRPGGYPLPRLVGDAALAAYFGMRVYPVVKDQWCLDRRLRQIRRRAAKRRAAAP